MIKMYDTLVLSGGAVRGFGLLGAIQYIQDRDWLKNIHKYIGTSIGSLLGYLLCIGYTPTEIMVFMCQKGLFEKISNVDVMMMIQGGGALSFSIIQEMIEKMTIQKIKKYITFEELYTRFNKQLIVCVYNQTTNTTEYISKDTQPNMNCITAIRMSCSLPFLFQSFLYDDCQYIDGGIANNFPINQVLPEDTAIGIHLTAQVVPIDDHNNILKRIYSTLLIPIQRIEELIIKENHDKNITIVDIKLESFKSLHFNLTNTDKFDMFSTGYQSIKNHFTNIIC